MGKINYLAILYQGARNQLDLCTQIKRQRLFYSRIGDFLSVDTHQRRISFNCAVKCYQEMGDLENCPEAVRKWKNLNWYNWRNWQFNSVHILVPNTAFEYNIPTQMLVADHNMAITAVDDSTVATLSQIVSAFWRQKTSQKWSQVAEDKELWYIGFQHSHSISSALEGRFGPHGGHRATGKLASLVHTRKGKSRIAMADEDLKRVITQALEMKLPGSAPITSLALQPSFMMSQVHKPQHPHFDYSWDPKKKNRGVRNVSDSSNYWIGFLPVTDSGQFLQIWKYQPNIQEEQHGEIVFIPKGTLLLVPGHTLHAGGFRAASELGNKGAHGRVHFYIYPGHDVAPIDRHTNEYWDPHTDRRVRLSTKYKNSELLDGILSGGIWCDSMQWSFFQGECPIEKEVGATPKVKKNKKLS